MEKKQLSDKKRKTQLFLFFITVVLLLFFAFQIRQLDWPLVMKQLEQVQIFWLLLAIATHYGVFACWIAQWLHFIPKGSNLSVFSLFRVSTVFSTATNSLPFGGGHAYGTYYLSRTKKFGLPAALAVLTQDQIVRGISKLFLFGLFVLLAPVPDWFQTQPVYLLLAGLFIGIIGILFLLQSKKNSSRSNSRNTTQGYQKFIAQWKNSLRAFQNKRAAIWGIIFGILLKFNELLPLLFVNLALGIELAFWGVLLLFVTLNISTALSVSPGNIGVYEATAFFTLSQLGISEETALSAAVLYHVCWLLPMAGTGIPFLLKDIQRLK